MSASDAPLVIAEFRDADDLCAAARNIRMRGFDPVDALTPCPVEELDDILRLDKSPIRWPMLIAALAVAAAAYALEFWSAVYAYPIDSGGRPLNSWPIFLLVPFEVGVLAAAVAGFAALLVLCGLPRLHHPLFDSDAIERATDDRYFLLVRAPPKAESDGLKVSSLRCESGADRGAAVMRPALVASLALALCGCTDQSMTKQPRYGPNGPAPVFANGSAAQTPPDGAVAEDAEAYAQASATPPPVDLALLRRGKERFEIFCSPCHGFEGDGDGAIVRRGFPRPPSYYDAALMGAPGRLFFDTITNGFGVMYAYGSRVPPHDRWAITAYIRALQQSRSTKLAAAPGAGTHP